MTPPEPGGERLRADALACGYGRGDVLTGVTLGIEPGTILALLGPNGSGKTTLLRTLARLLKPRDGVVYLDGAPLLSGRDRSRVHLKIAVALPDDAGGSTLTVEEVVRLGRAAHRGWWRPMSEEDAAAIELALGQVDLGRLRDRPIAELSSGEWQRVLLAKALARGPTVLLLDEPTAHLDLNYQIEILELVRRLAREGGLAVVLSLHDVNQASFWADRIALVADGRLLEVGTPEDVLTTDLLRQAFRCAVAVERHPVSGIPMVLPYRPPCPEPKGDESP
ncbi:ABC transporter ATP-binding protein [Singulisphaera sp. PoT]|uniref:ABC transporter ATP-binding protein n=1 Tax=Singulisphaera sp. PoT TaxID=3411797 RepID=UPI003BF5B6C8